MTPDSFSDGGAFLKADEALKQAEKLLKDGADILDIGAESTRPGSKRVDSQTEWARLRPVVEHLNRQGLSHLVSIDTRNHETMLRSLDHGVAIINDVSASANADLIKRFDRQETIYLAMHMHGEPGTMQDCPLVGMQAVDDMISFRRNWDERFASLNASTERLWIDPGIGFGKDDTANLRLINWSMDFAYRDRLVVGISRKSFMGRLLGIQNPIERDPPAKMMELALIMRGVKAIRTHDVATLSRLRDTLNQ
ncbi:MAG: dihydropteroate synthase [Pseudobacteriovorax sp.]|nr:dihydropteroate synthase [Pseudobacteriovorax sp.]